MTLINSQEDENDNQKCLRTKINFLSSTSFACSPWTPLPAGILLFSLYYLVI